MSIFSDDGYDPLGFILAAVAGISLSVYGAYKGVTAGRAIHWALFVVGAALLSVGVYRLITSRDDTQPPKSERLPGDGHDRPW